MSYRENGVDKTEVEIARIRETEETKRQAGERAMKLRAASREAWFNWYKNNDAPGAVFGIGGVVTAATLSAIVIMYCAHVWFGR